MFVSGQRLWIRMLVDFRSVNIEVVSLPAVVHWRIIFYCCHRFGDTDIRHWVKWHIVITSWRQLPQWGHHLIVSSTYHLSLTWTPRNIDTIPVWHLLLVVGTSWECDINYSVCGHHSRVTVEMHHSKRLIIYSYTIGTHCKCYFWRCYFSQHGYKCVHSSKKDTI